MRFELFVGLRYLFFKKRNAFISIVSWIAVLGIAIGAMTLIVVIGVMTGFDRDLHEKIVGSNPHILIEKEGGIDNPQVLRKKIRDVEGVVASAPSITGQAVIKHNGNILGVFLRGIDPLLETKVTRIDKYITSGGLRLSEKEIIVGKELAVQLNLVPGGKVNLISPVTRRTCDFTVAAIFDSGYYEYDSGLVFISLEEAKRFFDTKGKVNKIGVRVADVYRANRIKWLIQQKLGSPYWVVSWMDLNKNFFSALRLEKTAMFIILTLIVLVACFNVATSLIMIVMEKRKDIGILKSIGASSGSIMFIFTFNGLLIGMIGVLLGLGLGLSLAGALAKYQFVKLPEGMYYLDKIPVQIESLDVLFIVSAAILISFFATLYPAWQAAKLNPVEALRYE